MTSQTPIFDQLVDEFNKSGVYEFGFVYENEPRPMSTNHKDGMNFLANLGEVMAAEEDPDSTMAFDVVKDLEEEQATITHNTLYDASHLAVIKPAIPEMVKLPHGPTIKEDDTPTTVMERLEEADKDLGLDDFDEAFKKADEALTPRPGYIVTVPKKVTPADVAAFKKKIEESGDNVTVEQALPKRRNKRNNRNRSSRQGGQTANKAA